MRPRVKICCISSIDEAKLAVEFGASALGLVGNMPSGPGIIDDDLIAQITRAVPPPISTFLLTSETRSHKIIEHYRKANTSTLQLVDALDSNDDYRALRQALPHVNLVQVIHVVDDKSVAEAVEASTFVDAILLDSGNPNLAIKELGGTGRTHNWELSKEIRDHIQVPLFLAGGLNRSNVQQAIETVRPFGIDLCSSVRTDGQLDRNKLKAFFEAVARV